LVAGSQGNCRLLSAECRLLEDTNTEPWTGNMPTRIRLRRTGRKGQVYFRIVVAHQEMARDGRVVATLGHYNPRTDPATIQVDAEQARAWLDKGATPTDTVRSLLRRAGVLGRGVTEAAPSPAPAPAAPVAPPGE
jgi:small subunit ribosomal protein S16